MNLSGGMLVIVTLGVTAGCADPSRPVSVKGKVTLDGQPVEGALVKFLPEGKQGREANGRTKADGTFTLTTVQTGDGAAPGTYKVVIEYHEPPVLVSEAKSQQEAMDAIAKGRVKKMPPKYVIPPRFCDPNQTPLRHKVPDDGEANIALQSSPT